MVEEYDNPNKQCGKCGGGYKRGFFERCPHCGNPTGEVLSRTSAEPKTVIPIMPTILPGKKKKRRR